jgi:hypothetical protein
VTKRCPVVGATLIERHPATDCAAIKQHLAAGSPFPLKTLALNFIGLLLAVAVIASLAACTSKAKSPEPDGTGISNPNISRIEAQNKSSDGVDYIEYHVYIKAEANWSSLSDQKRQEITDASVKECRVALKNAGGSNLNIIGFDDGTQEAIFIYDVESNEVIVDIDKVEEKRLPAPALK